MRQLALRRLPEQRDLVPVDQALELVLRGIELRLPEVLVTWLLDVPSHVVLGEVGDSELLLHGGIIESFKP